MFFSVISYVNIQTHCDHILPNALNKLRMFKHYFTIFLANYFKVYLILY